MTSTGWMKANYELRHIMARFAVHGFHYRICRIDKYHQPDGLCVCKLCGEVCDR
jgi:hypothetical protein